MSVGRAHRRLEHGFTLIELLIVVIILGVLAAIAVFAVGAARKDAVASSCRADAKSIETSVAAVLTKTGRFPTSQPGVVQPSPGALLRSWPSSSNYSFAYASPDATHYVVTIGGPRVTGGVFDEVSNAGVAAACQGT